MVKNEKGVTLVVLIITVVIILILTSTIVMNVNTRDDYKEYRKMCADIECIKDQVLIYFKNYGEIPKGNKIINASSIKEAEDETGSFYNVDITKFSNLTLNFGTGEGKDIYIINENSLNVYYLQGVELDGKVVHAKE